MSDMPNVILLKTRPENFERVIERQRHALDGMLSKAQPGDLLLLARTQNHGSAQVHYAMWFERQRRASAGEVEENWPGNDWDIIVEGRDCCRLERPFDPQLEKVSQKSYGQGGTIFYIEAQDAEHFRRQGFLRPVLA